MQALTFLTLSFLSFTPALAQDLVAALQADPDLSTLLSAISAVPGLADTLDAAEGITIFAPTNEAFAAVDPDSAEGTAIGASDVPGIASILSYHVVPATIPSTAITETPQFVQTLLTPANLIGGEVAALVPGGQYLGAQVVDGNVVLKSGLLQTSTVTQADIVVGGATIHKIDTVLTLPAAASTTASAANLTAIVDTLVAADLAGLFDNAPQSTIFIPTDDAFDAIADVTATLTVGQVQTVLLKHLVIGGVVFSPQITANSSAVSALGEVNALSSVDGTVTVAGATVVVADVLLKNGVGHVIDSVLIPDSLSTQEKCKRQSSRITRKRL